MKWMYWIHEYMNTSSKSIRLLYCPIIATDEKTWLCYWIWVACFSTTTCWFVYSKSDSNHLYMNVLILIFFAKFSCMFSTIRMINFLKTTSDFLHISHDSRFLSTTWSLTKKARHLTRGSKPFMFPQYTRSHTTIYTALLLYIRLWFYFSLKMCKTETLPRYVLHKTI